MLQLQVERGLSQRRAIRLIGCNRKTARYLSKRGQDVELRERLKTLAHENSAWGYKLLRGTLRGEGFIVNLKKLYRLYKEEQLQLRRKGEKRFKSEGRGLPQAATLPNQEWCLDFLHDSLSDGRFGILAIISLFVSSTASADSLSSIFQAMGDLDWNSVRVTAQTQANNNTMKYKSTQLETKVFEGDFTPTKSHTKLAILSDGGVDVFIDNATTPVLQSKNVGQAAPNLSQSLHQIPVTLIQGQTYHIKVDYNNIFYTPGGADYDGVTLFAYLGSGDVTGVTPNAATKVLISKKRADAYPNALQTQDARIRVKATVQNVVEGQKFTSRS